MHASITNLSHLDKETFHNKKTEYSHNHMLECIMKTEESGPKIPSESAYKIVKNKKGKPIAYRKEDTELLIPFSVTTSHSYPYIYSAAYQGGALIGCDVEKIRKFEEFFLSSFLHENEKTFLKVMPIHSHNEIATKIWTIKESFLKAIGCGLLIHPKRLDVVSVIKQDLKEECCVFFDGKKVACTLFYLKQKEGFIFCLMGVNKEQSALCTL